MFIINIYLRFALIALFLGGGLFLSFVTSFWYALPLLLIGIGLVIGYFLLGTIASAGKLLETMDIDGASKRLDLTFFPNLLYPMNKAIYKILRGTIAAQKGDNKTAETIFQEALAMDMPSDNERAMVLLQMAGINGKRSNWAGVRTNLEALKKLKVSEPMIKEQILHIEKSMQSRGQVNVARSMGKDGFNMMKQGGMSSKRRRPKMR